MTTGFSLPGLCRERCWMKNCANYHIVVVDNGSKQVEVDELEAFCDEKKASVTLIKSSQNLGFARGNNLGFRYIREHIQCKYIAMINSDTLIVDRTFCAKIDEAFNKYHFAVLGPDVLPAHSNPMVDEPDSKEKVLQQIAKTKKQIKIIKTPGVNILSLDRPPGKQQKSGVELGAAGAGQCKRGRSSS